MLTERQLDRILNARQLVEEFELSGLSVRAFAKRNQVPTSTFRRILAAHKEGALALIDGRTKRSGRKPEIDERSLTWAVAYLAAKRQATLSSAWRELQPVAQQNGWAYPSYGQIRRAIGGLSDETREMLIDGTRHHFENWVSSRGEKLPLPISSGKWMPPSLPSGCRTCIQGSSPSPGPSE